MVSSAWKAICLDNSESDENNLRLWDFLRGLCHSYGCN
jgi:hypothetical protein